MLSSVLLLVNDSELEERGASIDERRVKREKRCCCRGRTGEGWKKLKEGERADVDVEGSSGNGWVDETRRARRQARSESAQHQRSSSPAVQQCVNYQLSGGV
jgi:hypothetical protein